MCILCKLYALDLFMLYISRDHMSIVHAMKAFANIASERDANIQVSINYWHFSKQFFSTTRCLIKDNSMTMLYSYSHICCIHTH